MATSLQMYKCESWPTTEKLTIRSNIRSMAMRSVRKIEEKSGIGGLRNI